MNKGKKSHPEKYRINFIFFYPKMAEFESNLQYVRGQKIQ